MVDVVNKRKDEYTVYIGRGSRWGNPFRIGVHGNRDTVIEKYRMYLWRQICEGQVTVEDLLKLENEVLGCFCKPAACHGDVLAAAVRWARKGPERWPRVRKAT